MKNNNNQKLIFFHPTSLQKQGFLFNPSHRLYLLAFVSLFTLILLFLAILTTKEISFSSSSTSSTSRSTHQPPLSPSIVDALLHYSSSFNSSGQMSLPDLRSISDALRHCSPCNFLVFGLGHETLLWKALNYNGRTVFLGENGYFAAWFEEKHPHLESYNVRYTTKVAQLPELLFSAKDQIRKECRPVQNLLFSNCPLAINDLPNQLYGIDWDVILVDGPRGYSPEVPGRMSAIFTSGVLGRSKRRGGDTHVFVHDFEREVERVCSEEFLCKENLVGATAGLAHFVIGRRDSNSFEFCHNSTSSSSSSSK